MVTLKSCHRAPSSGFISGNSLIVMKECGIKEAKLSINLCRHKKNLHPLDLPHLPCLLFSHANLEIMPSSLLNITL